MTTPISPAGTCTHGNFFTPKSGHSRIRKPGMSNVAWYPASPRNAIGLSEGKRRSEKRFCTNPISTGPMTWTDCATAYKTNTATSTTTTIMSTDTSIASCDYPRPPRPVGRR